MQTVTHGVYTSEHFWFGFEWKIIYMLIISSGNNLLKVQYLHVFRYM